MHGWLVPQGVSLGAGAQATRRQGHADFRSEATNHQFHRHLCTCGTHKIGTNCESEGGEEHVQRGGTTHVHDTTYG